MKTMQTVKIQRQKYTFSTDESSEYTENLAMILDKKLNDKRSKNQGLSSLDAAYLVAFDCMDEIVKVNANIENIRTRIQDYVDEANTAKKEKKELEVQLEEAQRKVSLLREKYAELFNEYKRLKSALRGNSSNQPKEEEKPAEKPQAQTAAPAQTANQGGGNFVGMTGYNPGNNGGKK